MRDRPTLITGVPPLVTILFSPPLPAGPGGVQLGNLPFPNAGVPWQPGRGDFRGNTVVFLEDEELGNAVGVMAAGGAVGVMAAGDDVAVMAAFCVGCLVLDTLFGGGCTPPSPLVFLAAVLALVSPGSLLL